MRNIKEMLLCILALTLAACNPSLEGDWELEIGSAEGIIPANMTLEQKQDSVEGTISMFVYGECPDLMGTVTGKFDDTWEHVEFIAEFAEWTCEGYVYTFCNLRMSVNVNERDGEIRDLSGEGSWCDSAVGIEAYRL